MEISVRITPGARKERILKVGDHSYEITVREKAEENRANERVRAIVADLCSVPASRARIIRGHRSPKKVIRIT